MNPSGTEAVDTDERYRLTFERAPVGLAHVAPDGRYLDANARFCEILGCTREELLRSRWFELTHPDDVAEDERLRDALLAGTRDAYEREKRYGREGARTVWAHIRVALVRDAAGAPTHFIVAIEDVTGRRDAERRATEAVAETERERARLAQVLSGVSDAFVLLGRDWRYLLVNARAAEMFGRSAEELVGRHIWTEFPDGVGQPFFRAYERVMATGVPETIDEHYAPWDRWFENRVYPTADGIAIFFQEITDRKRAERWHDAQRRVLEMVATGQPLLEVMTTLALAIEAQLPAAHCTVLLLARPRGTLHSVAAPSVAESFTRFIEGVSIGPTAGSCGTAAFRREVVVVEDLATDPLWDEWRDAALAAGLRACWSAPILDGAGEVLGTFALYHGQKHAPLARERALVDDATRLAGIVIAKQQDEDAVRHRERDLALLADNVPDIISRWDRALRCTFVNAAVTRQFGPDADALLALTPLEAFAAGEGERLAAMLREVLDGGEPVQRELRFTTSARGPRWMSVRALPERDVAGAVCGVLVLSRDVTDERDAFHALRESERRFRLLVENIGEVFYVTDPTFSETVYVSPAFEAIWGVSLAALRQSPGAWRGAIVPEDRARVDEAVRNARDGAFALEYRIRRPDGGERYIRDRAFGVRDHTGAVVRSVGIAEDLTERVRIEGALRASEAEHRALVEAMDDVIVVIDAEGRYLKVAPTAPALLYRTADDLLGRTLHEVFPRDIADRFLGNVHDVLRERRPLTFEYSLQIGAQERWFLASVSPMDGDVLWVARDITQRRAAERGRAEALERYRLAARATQDILWDLDAAAGIVEWSEALGSVLGHQVRRTESVTWWAEHVHPDDHARVVDGYQAALVGAEQYWSDEYRFRRADGEWATLFDRVYFVRDEAGRVTRAIGAMTDLTERKRLEDQLRQAQKMEAVGRLAGGVAHDFNNLLTAIMSSSELALADLPPAHPVRADVEEVRRAADRAAGLTRQLLAFSRKQVLQPTVLDPNAVVADVEQMLRRVIGAEVELRTALAPRPGHVRADRGQLEQVLMNLAVNGRDAMPGGGVLEITTGDATVRPDERAPRGMRPGSYVTIEVRDTGHGMDEATQARVFEPFFTTKGVGRGTGLGLATVYGIVKQSEGYVYLRSAPGQGATFSVYLPRVEGAEAPPPAVADDAVPARPALPVGAETVLLVEDEPAVRTLARRALVRYGYTVVEASNGREALRLFDAAGGEVDLVVTDLSMPEIGGRELARRLRERRPGLRLLFMSGFADAGPLGDDPIEGGALIEKPFAMDVFVRRVRETLDA